MLSNKKCFSVTACVLLVLSGEVCAQTADLNQNKQPIVTNVVAMPTMPAKLQAPGVVPKSVSAVSTPGLSTAPAATSMPVSAAPTVASQVNQTQIELELNKKVSYKVFYLDKPDRLVVDIKDSSFSAEFDKSAFENSPIKNIRTGHVNNGVFRIVFDLRKAVTFQHTEQTGDTSSPESMKLIIVISPKDKS